MVSPMHKFLDHLISQGNEGGVPVQIQFKLGQPAAGGLRKGPVEGIFQFSTVIDVGPDAPEHIRALGQIVVSQYFEPDAIQQVIVHQEDATPRIVTPGAH